MDPKQTAKPLFNYQLRAANGQWLWAIAVTKGGLSFQVLDWTRVAASADQYKFHPQFIHDKNLAWIGNQNTAEAFKRILSDRCRVQSEIIEIS